MIMNFYDFERECYLRSIPSVDLNDVTSDNPVNCSKHKLSLGEYEKILSEYNPNNDDNVRLACNLWMIQSGPLLV